MWRDYMIKDDIMNISYNFYVDESENIVIEFMDSESGYATGATIYHEEIDLLKDNQYAIYERIAYCTFKALLLLVNRLNMDCGDVE